jgi:hypothetical protein
MKRNLFLMGVKKAGGMGSSPKETPLQTAQDTNESRDVWTESS